MPGGFYEAKERENGQNADTHPGMSSTFKRGIRTHSSPSSVILIERRNSLTRPLSHLFPTTKPDDLQ